MADNGNPEGGRNRAQAPLAAAPGVWVLPGPVNLGLVDVGGALLAVDSGLDAEAALRLIAGAGAIGLPLAGVFNTHGHADHCGGNHRLAKLPGLRILAPHGEVPLVEHGFYDPISLVGGAPFPEIRGKFLHPRPSHVDTAVGPGPLPIDFRGAGAPPEVVSLPGHGIDMCGLRAGGVFFTADAFFPPDIIVKHRLLYHFHPRRALATLGTLPDDGATRLVPSHGVPLAPPGETARHIRANAEHILRVEEAVLGLLAKPLGREEVAAALARSLGLADNHVVWALTLGTVQGYLTGLRELGLVESSVEGGKLAWRRR